jgi:hypothetical protein
MISTVRSFSDPFGDPGTAGSFLEAAMVAAAAGQRGFAFQEGACFSYPGGCRLALRQVIARFEWRFANFCQASWAAN